MFLWNKEAMDVAFSGLKKCCMEIRVYPFWLLAPSILVVRATYLQCESDGDNTCQDLRGLCCMVICFMMFQGYTNFNCRIQLAKVV
jgi:hypothetical protein